MRTFAVVVVLLSAGAACAAWMSHRAAEPYVSALDRERHRGEQLDILRQQQHTFSALFEARLADIVAGKRTLAEVTTATARDAAIHYPRYLDHVARVERGSTLREQIARNLMRYFQIHGPWDSGWCEDVSFRLRLEEQFAEAIR